MAIDIKKFIGRFIEEARDHMIRLGDGLDALERDPAGRENIDTIFRSAHTIKGSSRMLKLTAITETAHQLEDVLGALREGGLSYNADLGRLLYRGVDSIAAMVERLAENGELPPDKDEALCNELAQAAKGEISGAATPAPAVAAPSPQAAIAVADAEPAPQAAAAPAHPQDAQEARLKTPDTVRVRLTKLDELIKLMGEVVSSHARSRQRLADIREIMRNEGDPTTDKPLNKARLDRFAHALRDDVLAQELLMDELHSKTLIMRMLPLTIVFDPAGRMLRELARSIGKEIECVVTGAEIELDRQMIDMLSDPLVHLLRNAVDHGIETPEARRAAGKSPHGRISLSARQDGGWVMIEVADNGNGIPIAAVREKALRKGFISPEKAAVLTEQEIVDMIFLPGFSTSAIITDLSGRGVGMDVVKRCIVDDLKGTVSVDSHPGQGTTFTLRLPLSLAVMRVLLVAVNGVPFGFTAQYVAELIRAPQQEFLNVADRRAVIIRNEFVPVIHLADLMRIPLHYTKPTKPGRNDSGALLLVVRVRSEKLALVVDDLLDEHDMVIKPLPEHMRRISVVSGMVTTGKNELVNILHVPVLFDLARSARGEIGSRAQKSMAAPNSLRVLVVDDSLNTREIEKDVLEAHGYQVTLAEDGLDGLRKAQAGEFDAVLTDVEMPNMDGFTLTAKLRQEDKYRDIPIIIITSREKPEDKRRGIEAGADAYIVKGDFDQSSLVDTLRSLLG